MALFPECEGQSCLTVFAAPRKGMLLRDVVAEKHMGLSLWPLLLLATGSRNIPSLLWALTSWIRLSTLEEHSEDLVSAYVQRV